MLVVSVLSLLDTFLIGAVGGTVVAGVLLFIVLSLSDGPVLTNDHSVVEEEEDDEFED